MKNVRSIVKVLGTLFSTLGIIMLGCTLFSIVIEDNAHQGFAAAGISTLVIGLVMFFSCYSYPNRITKKEGYLIVGLSWLGMAVISALPYILCLELNVTDAFFESTSGLTTTGATIFNDVEVLPRSILLWRSLTQWIGGMGIIVLTVAILPLLGVGGVELFTAEAPGPTSDKIHPRIRETAKRLWMIYLGFTLLLTLLLWLEGMTLFDAVNHGLTTMATGGFSTKNASIAHFSSPMIEYTIGAFMLLAGINYTVHFFFLTGRWKKVFSNEEWRTYMIFVGLFVLIIAGILILNDPKWTGENALRSSFFQVTSIITTTGFVIDDYTGWGTGITFIFFLLLFMGGCAGSTSGGIKMIRHLVFIKNSYLEFKRLLHPKAVIRLKINQEVVPARVLTHILVFLLLYMIVFFGGCILLSFGGLDFETALGAMATSLSNVGPAIGKVGPVNTFAFLDQTTKAFLAFIMLIGRLEIYSILILLTPFYWRDF
ncbi:MAG: potassium transporter TrkG [Saprospiraceae bacterium]|nr:potassium transporter TrkG [Saprospiraceae bacterium]